LISFSSEFGAAVGKVYEVAWGEAQDKGRDGEASVSSQDIAWKGDRLLFGLRMPGLVSVFSGVTDTDQL
jgi:hypothetical protein